MKKLLSLFLALYLNTKLFGNENVLIFGVLNLIIALFNLMPVAGLDGGSLLFILIARISDEIKARKTVKIVTATITLIILCAGFFVLINGKVNISLFIMALYFFISCIIKI